MASKQEDDLVVFIGADGKEISNDPRWLAKKAMESDSDGVEDDDEGTPYDDWKGAQLKAEVTRRNDSRDEDAHIDVSGFTKKSEFVAALVEDDEKYAQA